MRIQPDSISGQRLRRYGIASQSLSKTFLLGVWWMPVSAFTVPLPFDRCLLLAPAKLLQWDAEGELEDGLAMAPLVHQYVHAYQRLEWGFFPYLGRHLASRLGSRRVPVHRRQVEREAYAAAALVEEASAHVRTVLQHPTHAAGDGASHVR